MINVAERFSRLVRRNDIEGALRGLDGYFEGLSKDLHYFGTSFPFPEFDEICAEIGRRSAWELLAHPQSLVEQEHDLVLITEAIVQGGHAEIIRDLAQYGERPLLIVATNLYERFEDKVLPAIRKHPRVIDVLTLNTSEHTVRLRQLQFLIANAAARRVMLLCHPRDAIAVSAAASVRDKPVLFFHHCDHCPCLGCFLPNAIHIDLHNLGFQHCRNDLGIDSGYICLTSRDVAIRHSGDSFTSPMFSSVTCGGEHKLVNFQYPITYAELVIELIRSRRGVHFHVGRLSPQYVASTGQALEDAGLSRESFVHVGHISGFREVIEGLEADLYVPTLPQGGGKALIDAMSAGVPILVHENAIGRLWGGRDLVYSEAPHWNSLDTLRQCLTRFDDLSWRRDQANASRSYFDRYHSTDLFQRMLHANGRLDGFSPPPLKPYRPSHHERFNADRRAAGVSSAA